MSLIVLSSPRGISKMDPTARLVAGAFKTACVDECFKPEDRVCINRMPVFRDDSGTPCKQMGSKIGDNDPWKNQEAGVVGQQMQILLPQLGTPSNVPVPAPDMPRSRRPRETGNGSSIGKGQVLEMFSNGLCVPQIVKLSKECVMELFKRSSPDLTDIDGNEAANVGLDGTLIDRDGLGCLGMPPSCSTLFGGK